MVDNNILDTMLYDQFFTIDKIPPKKYRLLKYSLTLMQIPWIDHQSDMI